MKKIYIIGNNILSYRTEELTIGGVQTYVWNLAKLLKKNNYNPIILQCSKVDYKKEVDGIEIRGIQSKDERIRTIKKTIKEYLEKKIKNEIVIFSTEIYNFKNNFNKTISVQHGVYWDMDKKPPFGFQILEDIVNFARSFYIRKRIKYTKVTVCVDYNFVNWYRTQEAKNENIFKIIPNFSLLNENIKQKNEENKKIEIIFARRFEIYRGTRIFAKAVEKLIKEFNYIKIIFAGDGSDSKYLKEKFKNNLNISFIKYQHHESLDIHQNVNIAVVPTTGSEGTSLSVLEALASRCAVISTNVGGLSNIIINNFNGLLINPVEDELYDALKKLILDKSLRARLISNGLSTVSQAFNKENWDESWLNVIKNIENIKEEI